jgi:glycosyltransferase involved in cell wall biosynthesis
MKVVHVITGDEGGGGRAAYRLTRGLNRIGCDANLYVASKFHSDPNTVVFQPPNDAGAKLRRLLFRVKTEIRNRTLGNREGALTWNHECQRGDEPVKQLPDADLYNVHTVSNFFNYSAFWPAITLKRPVVWTLHIMAAFTGGCGTSYGCERFQTQCGRCPMLHSTRENDFSRGVWNGKQRIYSRIPAPQLHLVCPSEWMKSQVSKSSLMGRFRATVIPNAVDTDSYAPRDRAFARETLGIPLDAKVLLFISQHSLSLKGKGFDLLLETLRQMDRPKKLYLLTLGPDCNFDVAIPHKHLGHIFDDNILSLIYSAADLFVTPSLEDNLPNVVMESIACGTPVVGFAAGGIPELVRKNQTGEVVPLGDVRELRLAVEYLLKEDALRQELSRTCREAAIREYGLVLQAERYSELYKEMLAEAPASGAGIRKSLCESA